MVVAGGGRTVLVILATTLAWSMPVCSQQEPEVFTDWYYLENIDPDSGLDASFIGSQMIDSTGTDTLRATISVGKAGRGYRVGLHIGDGVATGNRAILTVQFDEETPSKLHVTVRAENFLLLSQRDGDEFIEAAQKYAKVRLTWQATDGGMSAGFSLDGFQDAFKKLSGSLKSPNGRLDMIAS